MSSERAPCFSTAARMARAMGRAKGSSPYSRRMRVSSRTSARSSSSASVSPSPDIRMSSGPGREKEKPRSATSSCGEETPRSTSAPSTRSMPSERQHALGVAEVGAHGAEGLAEAGQAGAGRGEGARVAVGADHLRTPLEQGLGVAAAAQRAVEDDHPGAGLEQLDDLALENGLMREPGHPALMASATSGWNSTPKPPPACTRSRR